jgi:hypothetical protein
MANIVAGMGQPLECWRPLMAARTAATVRLFTASSCCKGERAGSSTETLEISRNDQPHQATAQDTFHECSMCCVLRSCRSACTQLGMRGPTTAAHRKQHKLRGLGGSKLSWRSGARTYAPPVLFCFADALVPHRHSSYNMFAREPAQPGQTASAARYLPEASRHVSSSTSAVRASLQDMRHGASTSAGANWRFRWQDDHN